MPQLIAIAIAGAGILAGYKWMSRKATEYAEAVRAETEARAHAANAPKEMGQLEWDEHSQAYRPARR